MMKPKGNTPVLQLPQGPRATVFGNAATGDGAMPAQHCWDISCRLNCPDTPTAGTCLSVLKHIPLTHIASLDMVVSKAMPPCFYSNWQLHNDVRKTWFLKLIRLHTHSPPGGGHEERLRTRPWLVIMGQEMREERERGRGT